jgi:hypothetical protein
MEITFERRFRGPLTSANGGFACGSLAAFVDAEEVEVTLRLPPPLGRSLSVRSEGASATLLDGDAVVAEARPSAVGVSTPEPPVSIAQAEEAATRFVRIGNPAFRECFVCGVRKEEDGLAVYAGAVAGREPLVAAPGRRASRRVRSSGRRSTAPARTRSARPGGARSSSAG